MKRLVGSFHREAGENGFFSREPELAKRLFPWAGNAP